jgi:DNA-binding beta-propeller fold protein YncE
MIKATVIVAGLGACFLLAGLHGCQSETPSDLLGASVPSVECQEGCVILGRQAVGAIDLCPNDSTVYLGYLEPAPSRIQAFSTDGCGLTGQCPYGEDHDGLVVSADCQYVFATTADSGEFSRFDLATCQQVSLPAGDWPADVGATADRSVAVVMSGVDPLGSDLGDDALYVYDIAGGNFAPLANPINLPGEPSGPNMAFAPDGSMVYVLTRRPWAPADPVQVCEVSLQGVIQLTRSAALPTTRAHGIALADGNLYVGDWQNEILLVVDIATLAVVDQWPLAARPRSVVLHPDGRSLFVLLPELESLCVLDSQSGIQLGCCAGLQLGGGDEVQMDIVFTSDGSGAFVSDDSPTTVRAAVQLSLSLSFPGVTATIDLHPETLNLGSHGRWITCYIALPDGYDVADVDTSTIFLDGVVPAAWAVLQDELLMVKFDRSAVQAVLAPGQVELTVTGQVNGTEFSGSDTIRVIDPPPGG